MHYEIKSYIWPDTKLLSVRRITLLVDKLILDGTWAVEFNGDHLNLMGRLNRFFNLSGSVSIRFSIV